jgi:hypothetical protein
MMKRRSSVVTRIDVVRKRRMYGRGPMRRMRVRRRLRLSM